MKEFLDETTTGIAQIVEIWEKKLLSLSQQVISEKRNRQNRTTKQILGHLIDSASNNHQRMVRLQYHKELVFPDYRQDNDRWIAIQNYQESHWPDLVRLWKFYNLHMIHLIHNVDAAALQNTWHDFEGTQVTLKQMIAGYLDHLKLHVREIEELIQE